MSRRVLVTGGGGFIGSNLVRALVERGDEVRVLDNFSTGRRANLASLGREIEVVEGDLRSYERVHTAVRGGDVVFHQGALGSVARSVQDPLTTTAVNVEGTLNVLLAARDEDVRRVVFASSSSVYGNAERMPLSEEQAPNPISPYGVAKLAAERFCVSFGHVYGLETVALRYFNVFGPRQDPSSQYSAVIPKFIVALQQGQAPEIYGDGEQSRDFTFIDDVVQANLLAIDAPHAAGRAFNIACGQQRSLNELVRVLNRLLGTDINWFGSTASSMFAILLIQLWLGYNYMFLVITGALQSISSDLTEAAGVDGAKPFYAFRTITFPLLLVALAPLLITSFAFNFNNFAAIFLTSAGAPFPPDNPSAGSTDILITYTYRLAFGGSGADYGFAAAISVLIFLIVATVSIVSFRRTQALEEIN